MSEDSDNDSDCEVLEPMKRRCANQGLRGGGGVEPTWMIWSEI